MPHQPIERSQSWMFMKWNGRTMKRGPSPTWLLFFFLVNMWAMTYFWLLQSNIVLLHVMWAMTYFWSTCGPWWITATKTKTQSQCGPIHIKGFHFKTKPVPDNYLRHLSKSTREAPIRLCQCYFPFSQWWLLQPNLKANAWTLPRPTFNLIII